MEPTLLLPMGFGAILVNLPVAVEGAGVQHMLDTLFSIGIEGAELFPLMLFIGIGAMIDFQPLLTNPKLLIFGAAAQFGIFSTPVLALIGTVFLMKQSNPAFLEMLDDYSRKYQLPQS